MSPNDSVKLAQQLAGEGFAVIPVGANRVPLMARWQKHFADSVPKAQDMFLKKYPHALVGIVTGKPSNVIVIDVDNKKEFAGKAVEHLEMLIAEGWPKTMTTRTQTGGFHLYYRDPGGIKTCSGWRPGVDIRAEGGQVVAPGQHGEEGKYEWLIGCPPATLPLSLAAQLPTKDATGRGEHPQTRIGLGGAFVPPAEVRAGSRDETFFKYASSLQAKGVKREAALLALAEYYDTAVVDKDGFSRDDALAKVGQVYDRYDKPVPSPNAFGVETTAGETPKPEEVRAFYDALDEMEERHVYVEADGVYYDTKSRLWKKSYALAESTRRHKAWLGHRDNRGEKKYLSLWEYFQFSPRVRTVNGVGFFPNEERIVMKGRASYLNAWDKPEAIPEEGSIEPFMAHIDALFPEPPAREWVLDWFAHLVQYPGEKIGSTVLLSSTEEGLGKSVIGKILAPILGSKNISYVGASQIKSAFNEYMEQSTLVIVEEFSILGRWEVANKLKDMITNDTVRINSKFRSEYNAPNHVNFLFFSNYPDAAALSNVRERRTFIHHSDMTKDELAERFGMTKEAYYDRLWTWTKGMGPAYLAYYLLRRDITEFHKWRRFEPPLTDSKQFAVSANLSDFESWIESNHGVKSGPFAHEITSVELLRTASEMDGVQWQTRSRHEAIRWLRWKATGIGLLKHNGRVVRAYALEHPSKWTNASHSEKLKVYREAVETTLRGARTPDEKV